MPLIPASRDDTPADRLALYRERGVTHTVLLLPWDSLSPLRQAAALQLAAEWGRELAEVDTARRDLAHAMAGDGELQLAGLWFIRLMAGPIHQADAHDWLAEVERWKDGEGTDPRLRAFADAWHQAVADQPPVPPPGPECPCPACTRTYPKRRRRRR
jgi:hypothetical protein